ncbi:DUF979 domain-containing protein [Lapillicoccus jejuensis]|uniref:Putative membrane protein n=1 Tax=Lapillicoccus jejuensis TaxID=402171 RepID=A0A542DWK3_9MICO|nr:DUF979 domain-containing protein [Lapillicoccus jejuensis]TQJ07446.1 putative membrane protein [Lapillicoccus jejuensis]
MIKVEWVYWLVAAVFLVVAVLRLSDRSDPKRLGSAAFWAVLAFTFVYGTYVVAKTAPPVIEGVAVLVLVVLAALGFPGRGSTDTTTDEQRVGLAERFGNRLFVPALVIPVVAVLFGAVLAKVSLGGRPLLEPKSETIIGLGAAALVGVAVALAIFRPRSVVVPFREGDRLLGHIGWAAILPQFLATLGLLFTTAGVGDAVGRVTHAVLPDGQRLLAVVVYCLGMAVFTIVMGNAFAAFPVMTAAIGWPVLVQQYHGNPPAVFAIGMLAGFCGTLVTPMAANFNLVPAALLELKDQYGPIKAQLPTAVPLWVGTTAVMALAAFPR